MLEKVLFPGPNDQGNIVDASKFRIPSRCASAVLSWQHVGENCPEAEVDIVDKKKCW